MKLGRIRCGCGIRGTEKRHEFRWSLRMRANETYVIDVTGIVHTVT